MPSTESAVLEPPATNPSRVTSDDGDFAALRNEIRSRGLLQPRTGWYARSIAGAGAGWLALGAAMVVVGASWWQLACAVLAAVLSARAAFIGHDAGHQQISRSRRTNRRIGLVHGNLLTGMSYCWWVGKHNKHHAHPNDVARDPDVGPGPIAWTPSQAAHGRPLRRWLTRHQAGLFFPLLLLEAINLKVSSVRAMRRGVRRSERILLMLHYAGYLAFVLAVMPPWQALAFIAVHQALFGLYLGIVFAPNHKGMPMPPPGVSWGHCQQQVLTSRNVGGGPVIDWLFGGLNYQIEHHLFPSMPRPSLTAAQLIVRRHCARAGLPYVEESAVVSYRQALTHLATVGRDRRADRVLG